MALVSGCGEKPPLVPSTTAAATAAGYSVAGVLRESLPANTPSAPIAGARIEILAKPGLVATAQTAADGSYRLTGVAGTFQIRGSKPGYQTQTVTVQALSADRMVDLTLEPIPRRLFGTVSETPPTEARPIAGARITVVSGANAGASTTTDADGRYTVPSLWGDFSITVSRDGYTTASVPVTLNGEDQAVAVRLAPAPKVVTETFDNSQGTDTRHPLSVSFPVHNAGEVVITDWSSYGFEEGDGDTLQIWEDGRLMAQTYVERSFPRHTPVLRVTAVPGKTYEVRAIVSFWWYHLQIVHPS